MLGGRLAFSGLLPYGNLEVGGNVVVPAPALKVEQSDDLTALGDPVRGRSVGWKHRDGDKFRAWSVYSSMFIPIGDYEVGRLANTGKNRWALDVGGAYTMANFKGGREFSARARIHVQRRERRYQLQLRPRDAPRDWPASSTCRITSRWGSSATGTSS